MPEEILTIVKIPLSEITESLRNKHELPSKITDARIEGDTLILTFTAGEETIEPVETNIPVLPSRFASRKRRRAKRNRMKTRGWAVVARITNSKGQQCSIYKPFVEALSNNQLSTDEQRKKVETILRANRNKPSDDSIQYFLDNTLEYLKGQERDQQ